MKIDPTSLPSLIERMQRAAATAPSAAIAPAHLHGAESVGQAADVSPLEATVRVTAERVLAGDFESVAAVRSDVVEAIVRQRWAGQLPDARLEAMVGELSSTLTEDPEFMRQIDEMLILAAREVGDS